MSSKYKTKGRIAFIKCKHSNRDEVQDERIKQLLVDKDNIKIQKFKDTWEGKAKPSNFVIYGQTDDNLPVRYDSPVEAYISDIMDGMVPSPEILLVIYDMFSTYLEEKGNVSLEEIFFGKPKRSMGNYAARKAHFERVRHKYLTLLAEKSYREAISKTKIPFFELLEELIEEGKKSKKLRSLLELELSKKKIERNPETISELKSRIEEIEKFEKMADIEDLESFMRAYHRDSKKLGDI